MNINSRVKKLEDEAEVRQALPVRCTCIEQRIEVFGRVEFVEGEAHEHLELTPEQEVIVDSQKACLHDHSGEGVQVTIIPPLSEEMKAKLGL